jgi:hypothetical protein
MTAVSPIEHPQRHLCERFPATDASGFSRAHLATKEDGDSTLLLDDLLIRLGELLVIHKSLRSLFPGVGRGYDWVRPPNDAFGGLSALDLMLRPGRLVRGSVANLAPRHNLRFG